MGSCPAWQRELERRVRAHEWCLLNKSHLARWLELHDCPMPFALQCDTVDKERLIKLVLMRLKSERRKGKLLEIQADADGRVENTVVVTPEKSIQTKRRLPDASTLSPHEKKRAKSACITHQTKDWLHTQWRFVSLLGQGSCSRVRRGVRRSSNDEFAVKIVDMKKLQLRCARASSGSNDILSEVNIAKMLCHPGIVRCHDCFQIENNLYIIMEFMKGGNLLEHIEEDGYFVEEQARLLLTKLCAALRYLHGRRIVHRDIKGENILLTSRNRRDPHPKLSDFGVSSRCLGTHDRQTIRGTMLYMAPEIWELHNRASPSQGYGCRADMWSLGVVLYIVLCACPPFDDFAFDGRLHFEEAEWASVSAAGKDLVCRLIVTNPAERLSSQDVLNHSWFQPNLA